MRILVWGINYPPELTGIAPFNADLCEFLVREGHEVTMVTAFPYYPEWRKRGDDRGKWFRRERINNVRVFRCGLYVPKHVTPVRRVIHELSFGLSSMLRLLTLPRPDIYFVVSPPLLLGPCARVLTALFRRPYVFHVQDLQPDAAVGLGMLRKSSLLQLLYRMESTTYHAAALVSGISHGMLRAFREKGVSAERCHYLPNWITRVPESGQRSASKNPVSVRARMGVP